MNLRVQKALINDINFRFFSVDLDKLYYSSGTLIANKLIELFGKDKSYAVVCGLGGNAADGLSVAMNLAKEKIKVSVYVVGRVSYSASTIFKDFYSELEELKVLYKNLSLKQDCYAEDIEQPDIVIESLIGTGMEGTKLNKRFHDTINRISHFKTKIVAIDMPAVSYTPDLTISLNYPKVDTAITVEIPESKDASLLCGPGEVQHLFNSKQKTHKLKNGKVLYVSSTNNKEEFESIKKAANAYSCDLYIYNFNNSLKELKGYEFIGDLDIEKYFIECDSVIIGSIDEKSLINLNMIKYLVTLDKTKKFVLTWNVLESLQDYRDLEYLQESILLLNRSSSESILKEFAVSEKSLSQVLQTNIFFAGFQNTLYSKDGDYKININPKLTTDESVKVLANLCAVLLTKNDAWLTIRSSVFLFDVAQKLGLENKASIEENLKDAIDLCKDF